MLDLLTILFIMLALLGAWLFRRGWTGRRVDNHPWCRACRFDLVGSWPGSLKCPECGADLTRKSAVARGQRRRRPAVLAIGAAMFLAAAAIPGLTFYRRVSPINWNALKPAAWLVRDLDSTKIERAEGALAELVARDGRADLASANRIALLDHIYQSLIPQQRSSSVEWAPVVERAWLDGLLSTDRIAEYARNTLAMSLYVDQAQPIHQGDVLRFRFSLRPPYGHRSEVMDFEIRPLDLRLGDLLYQVNPRTIRYSMVADLNTSDGSVLWDIPVEVEPGRSVLHVSWRVNCVIAGEPQTALMWEDSLDLPVEVLPPGPESVTFVSDEESAKRIRDGIHFNVVGITRLSPEDDGVAIVGELVLDDIDIHASIGIDLAGDDGAWKSYEFPMSTVWWGSRRPICVLIPAGQKLDWLELIVFARDSSYRRNPALREFNGIPRDNRPLWFGPPMTIRVPVQWVDDLGSDRVSDEMRSQVEEAMRRWTTERDR